MDVETVMDILIQSEGLDDAPPVHDSVEYERCDGEVVILVRSETLVIEYRARGHYGAVTSHGHNDKYDAQACYARTANIVGYLDAVRQEAEGDPVAWWAEQFLLELGLN